MSSYWVTQKKDKKLYEIFGESYTLIQSERIKIENKKYIRILAKDEYKYVEII